MLGRYLDRPDKLFCRGHYAVLNDFCYAKFLRYYVAPNMRKQKNDWQSVELSDEILKNNFSDKVYPH